MNNSFKAIIFVIPFMLIVSIFSFIVPNIPGIENGNLFFVLLVSSIVIIFPLIQCFLRYLYFKKHFDKHNYLFDLKLAESKLSQRITYYLFIFLILVFPIIGTNFNFNNLANFNILVIILSVLASELLLYISFNKTKSYFYKDKILIFGIDLRIHLPIGNTLNSNSGVYYYGEFKYFKQKNNTLILFLTENDSLKIHLPENFEKQITNYLMDQGIKYRK